VLYGCGVNTKQVLGRAALGGVMVGLSVGAAAKVAGHRVRRRHEAGLDRLLDRPLGLREHSVATHDGGTVHLVEAAGDGRPVMLLHGVTLQWWVWSALITELRDTHRVLAWDMRGHGQSVAGTEGVSIEAAAHDLATVLETLDLKEVIVVGHSMGGMELGRFAVQHPGVLAERVAGSVFLATSASSSSIRGIAGGLIAFSAATSRGAVAGLRNPRLALRWRDNDATAALVRFAFGRRPTAKMVDDVRRMLADMPQQSLAEAGASIADHDVRSEVHAVRIPTLVIVGDRDTLTPPRHARELARLIDGAELQVLPSVGHQVMQEAPELLAESIEKFSARLDADPPGHG